MPDRIEPPILLSRLMTFVFATSLVVLGTLCWAVYKMFPLDRPQVFFLMAEPRAETEVILTEMVPSDNNLMYYKRAFIREYIRVRNEVIPNAAVMQRKYENTDGGIVRAWSNPDVFADFAQTALRNAVMGTEGDFNLRCSVEFQTGAIVPLSDSGDSYDVTFSYLCENSDGHSGRKDYTIRVRLERDDAPTIKWSQRLVNPLGIRVSEYKVVSGNGDPLETGFLAE